MDSIENSEKNFKQWYEQERKGVIIIACGLTILIVILITQYVSIGSLSVTHSDNIVYRISINEEQIKSLNDIALPTLIIFLLGLIFTIIGSGLVLLNWFNEYSITIWITKQIQRDSVYSKIQKHLSKKIFLLSSICYFLIISLFSSTIIYRPFSSFSQLYNAAIPSWHIIGCCGTPGAYPVLTVYFTNHFGLLLIPLNLILSSFLSLLVGANVLLFVYKIQNNRKKIKREQTPYCNIANRKNSTFLGIGSLVGLFVECPACAGNLIVYLIGSNLTAGGAIVPNSIITGIQPFFIIVSFILLIIPLLLIRKNISQTMKKSK